MLTSSRFVRTAVALAALAGGLLAAPALAWNAHGHRVIARLALDGLPADAPAFLRDASVADRVAEQSVEPDRWRGVRRPAINHEDNQDHYIDIDDLEQFGLTLETLPRLRYEYVKAMVLAKERHPERVSPYDASDDPDRNKEFPGFLPYAVANDWARLTSAMQTYRLLEALNDPTRAHQMEQARQNIVWHMGVLGHWVGDACQPLHTTRHHHGWVGENPNGYTRERGFHAYIDGTIVDHHGLTYENLKDGAPAAESIDPKDPWPQTLAYIKRSYEQVEPLYKLHKSGELTAEPGRALIAERLRDGGRMLGALYAAAWEASRPTDADVAAFIRFNEHRPKTAAPTAAPNP